MTALQLQLQLAERAGDDAQRQAAFAKLHQRLDRATHLVRQLLTAARQEGGAVGAPPMLLDLLELARTCVGERYDQASAKRIDLGIVEPERDAASPWISGSVDGLRILIGNLLDNALRYTPADGQVDLTVERTDGAILLRVADDGPGIAETDRQRVFDRFYRGAGDAGWGSGLGLSIVRSIADAHGSVVTLGEGLAGRGLAVTVCFKSMDSKLIR